MKSKLPNVTQKWSHCTTTKSELQCALNDPTVTAIESDLLMGHHMTEETAASHHQEGPLIPIMAHPPDRVSDLSMEEFINLTLVPSSRKHHIKLDFKELETVSKTIQYVNESVGEEFNSDHHTTVYLNADILPGPGKRDVNATINADVFIETCLKSMKSKNDSSTKFAFSLGWTTDPRAFSGYTKEDVDKMKHIIERHELLSLSRGVVLAVNARNLYKRIDVFDDFLKEFSSIQILAWTGTGEPPISNFQLKKITSHFKKHGIEEQLGFDCQTCAFLGGFFYDHAMRLVSILWNLNKLISTCFKSNKPLLTTNGEKELS